MYVTDLQRGHSFGRVGNSQFVQGVQEYIFCIPLVGAILYFVKKNDEPNAAKDACTFALIGVAIGIILNVGIGMLGLGSGM